MNFDVENKIGARFKFIVRKASTNEITKESGWFHNIVLDTGLAQMSVGTWIDRCCVGTGNSTPIASQTALDAFLASTTTLQASAAVSNTTTPPYYYGYSKTYRFGEGVAAGNLSEVGLGWGNSTLWNRALIKDANGNPTTITVLSDEFLDVVAEIRVYPQQSLSGSFNLLDKTGAIVSTHTYTGLPTVVDPSGETTGALTIGYVRVYSGIMNSNVTNPPSGVLESKTTATNTKPTPTSLKATIDLSLTQAIGSHQSFSFVILGLFASVGSYSRPGYKFQISPPIIKNNTKTMSYTFSVSWGRYEGT